MQLLTNPYHSRDPEVRERDLAILGEGMNQCKLVLGALVAC